MKLQDGQLRLAATDVSKFTACVHATAQDLAVQQGARKRPPYFPDHAAELLRKRGHDHEAAYLSTLRATHGVEEVPDSPDAAALTLDAMKRGVDVIYQGTLQHTARWFGRPDFLRRVDVPSKLGTWSYEPVDAKLARSAKATALLQLCFYAELLLHSQEVLPARMALVLGDLREEAFETSRYAAYFRHVRRTLEVAVATLPTTYPEPVAHCDVCDYATECAARRRADDHLSLVAGISRSQRRILELASVRTLHQLATAQLPRPVVIDGIGRAAFARIREQARIQVEGADSGSLRYELLSEVEPGRGLAMLPEPSPGDIFLDFEGDPYALGDGIEYLLGFVEPPEAGSSEPRYTALWAFDRDGERAAFERLMGLINERRARDPGMHVYHYNHYEPTSLKRLAGRYAACVDELDVLLRGQVFVDLYRAVRQGVRASVESYSIKRLEPLFGFTRSVPLRDANRCLAAFEAWMELRDTETPGDELRNAIQGYNRDDCLSAMRLRAWLEDRRLEIEQSGVSVTRPALQSGEANEDLAEQLQRVRAVASALLEGVPSDPDQRTPDQQARYVLAHLLEWHRREDKSSHWEYFRLCEFTDEELQEDGSAIGGLTYQGIVGKEKRSIIHRYRFPPQDHALDRAMSIEDPATQSSAGTRSRIDDEDGFVDLKRGATSTVPHPTALIPGKPLRNNDQRASLLRIGEHVMTSGITKVAPLAAAIALLRRDPPLPSEQGATLDETAVNRALAIEGSVLAVQGPPGTGKTHDGARMVVALVKAGKRVGITANSHKVITNLLNHVCDAARDAGLHLLAVQKNDNEDGSRDAFVRLTNDNDDVLRSLASGEANIAAGTHWLWSRPAMVGAVDVLFVDEAGQMSLANVLAAAPSCNGIALLGDPRQLDQPIKGVHPAGTAVSALGHILGDRVTIGANQGLFLEETWRMHPDVCAFISETFYEGRLRSRADLSRIGLNAPEPLGGTGLRFVPVEHTGSQNASPEEVEVVARLVQTFVGGGSTWTDRHGVTHPVGLDDVLIVAPYNAHVGLLRKRLPAGARIGTVDKFQGQQGPVVIYTMATSSPEDAPRGMEFLYSANRFNVAISRARCAAFLVGNPALFDVRCSSERQMALANAFCRFLELAREIRGLGASRVGAPEKGAS
ncbi:MAG: TM0106 family RecB-like putative nuclease [Polyangiaceae bacterium]